MIWKLANGLPNWRRSVARLSAVSKQSMAMPSALHATPTRVPESTFEAARKLVAPGRRCDSSTRTPSSSISAWGMARSATFPAIAWE